MALERSQLTLQSLLVFHFAILEPFDLSPDGIEIQNETITARYLDLAFRGAEEVLIAALRTPAQDLQAAELRIDDPVVADPEGGIFRDLLHSVPAAVAGCRGDDLDGDVGRFLDDAAGGRQGRAREVDGEIRAAALLRPHCELGVRAADEAAPWGEPTSEETAQQDHQNLMDVIRHLFLHQTAIYELSPLVFRQGEPLVEGELAVGCLIQ